MFDPHTIFYSTYLQPVTKKLYLDCIKTVKLPSLQKAEEELKTIKQSIESKVGSKTKEGKERKAYIKERLFIQRS